VLCRAGHRVIVLVFLRAQEDCPLTFGSASSPCAPEEAEHSPCR
jgi:hypothetical protein